MKNRFWVMTPQTAVFGFEGEEDNLPPIDGFPFRISEGNIVSEEPQEGEGSMPDIAMPRDPVYGELEDLANNAADIDDFVFSDGEVKPAGKTKDNAPVIHPPQEPNFGCPAKRKGRKSAMGQD